MATIVQTKHGPRWVCTGCNTRLAYAATDLCSPCLTASMGGGQGRAKATAINTPERAARLAELERMVEARQPLFNGPRRRERVTDL